MTDCRGNDSSYHATSKRPRADVEEGDGRRVPHRNLVDRQRGFQRIRGEGSKVMLPNEQRARPSQGRKRKSVKMMVAIPALQRSALMKRGGYGRGGPRPHIPRSIVEGSHRGFGRQVCVERDYISHCAHPAVGSARAAKERFAWVSDDLRGSQRGQTLPLDGPPVGLSLVPIERATVISDLEGDPHAKEYLLHNISSAVCRQSASSSWSRRTRGMLVPSRGP